jgi:hypothetical protein
VADIADPDKISDFVCVSHAGALVGDAFPGMGDPPRAGNLARRGAQHLDYGGSSKCKAATVGRPDKVQS